MTKIEFAKGMAFLGACLDRDISHQTVEAWFLLLGDLEARQFERAVVEVVRNHKFSGLPPVGLIRQAAGVSGGVNDGDAAAILAWDKVVTTIRREGAYKSIQWDDPAIPPAIESAAGGWAELCDTDIEELRNFTRKRFLDAYKAHRTAGTKSDGVSSGLIAQEAGRLGYESPEPVRNGDEPKRLYGFGGEQLAALPGPVAEYIPMLPDVKEILGRDDEPEPEIVETAEEFEARKAAMRATLSEKYGEPVAKR